MAAISTPFQRRRIGRLRAELADLRLAGWEPTLADLGDARLVTVGERLLAERQLDEAEEQQALRPYLLGQVDLPDPARVHQPNVERTSTEAQLVMAREFAERYLAIKRRVAVAQLPTPVVVVSTNGGRRRDDRSD